MRLTAFLALSALAIAPASAMAVANNPSAGECRAPGAGEMGTWNGTQLCAVEQGSGGGTGLGTGPGALTGVRTQPGEVVWVTGEIPVCLRNPSRCLSHEFGGRGGQEIKDGPGSGGPRGGGKGSTEVGRKAGTAKGKKAGAPEAKEKQAREECERYAKNLRAKSIEEKVPLPQFKAQWGQMKAQWERIFEWSDWQDQLLAAYSQGQLSPLVGEIDRLRKLKKDPAYLLMVPTIDANLRTIEDTQKEVVIMKGVLLSERRQEYARKVAAWKEAAGRLNNEEAAALAPLLESCKARGLIQVPS